MTENAEMTPVSALEPILGRWRTSGSVLTGEGAVESDIAGTDTYRLLPDGYWIAHEVDVTIGGRRTLAHELIGGSHPDGGWAMYAFDRSDAPGVMRLALHAPEVLLLEGNSVRSWFRFRAGPHHMATEWERVVDGVWIPWMAMRFDRME